MCTRLTTYSFFISFNVKESFRFLICFITVDNLVLVFPNFCKDDIFISIFVDKMRHLKTELKLHDSKLSLVNILF